MEFFEFYFNPKTKRSGVYSEAERSVKTKREVNYETFCFETKKNKEKLGNLYMAGELKGSLSKNPYLLSNLANIIKKEYYRPIENDTPPQGAGKNLQKALGKANEFLSSQIKNNLSLLGNLNFAVLTINQKFSLNFTKIGDIKIFLLKNNQILDTGKSIETEETRQLFQHIVVGKLEENDKILILNKEIIDLFEKENIFGELMSAKKSEVKKIFKKKKRLFKKNSGFCFLIIVSSFVKKIFTFPKISFPKINTKLKRTLISLLILIILLILGYLIFR